MLFKCGVFMLHKIDSLIVYDFLLRTLRTDKNIKHIDGFIISFINNDSFDEVKDFIVNAIFQLMRKKQKNISV